MEQNRNIRIPYAIGTFFLWFVLISAFPGCGYSQYYQGLPETCNIEQVFTPFSGIHKSCDFHFAYILDADTSAAEAPCFNYNYVLSVVNHSIAVLLREQRSHSLSTAGKPESMLIVRYSSDDQDDDDVCI